MLLQSICENEAKTLNNFFNDLAKNGSNPKTSSLFNVLDNVLHSVSNDVSLNCPDDVTFFPEIKRDDDVVDHELESLKNELSDLKKLEFAYSIYQKELGGFASQLAEDNNAPLQTVMFFLLYPSFISCLMHNSIYQSGPSSVVPCLCYLSLLPL